MSKLSKKPRVADVSKVNPTPKVHKDPAPLKVVPTESESELISLKTICAELGLDPQKARQRLRKSEFSISDKRWAWPENEVDEIKEFLSSVKAEPKSSRGKKKTTNEEVEEVEEVEYEDPDEEIDLDLDED